AHHLLPRHYDDLLLERDAEHRCGYPVWANAPKEISSRYRIRDGRIYDQEPLKAFCSSRCYRASAVYRTQLSEEPLFLRGSQSPLKIRLLPMVDLNAGSKDDDDTLRDKASLVSQPLKLASSATLDMDEVEEALEEICTPKKQDDREEEGMRIRERSVSEEAPEPPSEGEWSNIEGMRLDVEGQSFLQDEDGGEEEAGGILDVDEADRSSRGGGKYHYY
ncbi:Rtr1/RPAP2 family-domain-containing protein, partial [Piptocephalis cylindrospora]